MRTNMISSVFHQLSGSTGSASSLTQLRFLSAADSISRRISLWDEQFAKQTAAAAEHHVAVVANIKITLKDGHVVNLKDHAGRITPLALSKGKKKSQFQFQLGKGNPSQNHLLH